MIICFFPKLFQTNESFSLKKETIFFEFFEIMILYYYLLKKNTIIIPMNNKINENEKVFFTAIKLNPNQEKEAQVLFISLAKKINKDQVKVYPLFPTLIKLHFENKNNFKEIELKGLFQDENSIYSKCHIKMNDGSYFCEKLIALKKRDSEKIKIDSLFTNKKNFCMQIKVFKIQNIQQKDFSFLIQNEKWIKIRNTKNQ